MVSTAAFAARYNAVARFDQRDGGHPVQRSGDCTVGRVIAAPRLDQVDFERMGRHLARSWYPRPQDGLWDISSAAERHARTFTSCSNEIVAVRPESWSVYAVQPSAGSGSVRFRLGADGAECRLEPEFLVVLTRPAGTLISVELSMLNSEERSGAGCVRPGAVDPMPRGRDEEKRYTTLRGDQVRNLFAAVWKGMPESVTCMALDPTL